MFERFTSQARTIVVEATEHAQRRGAEAIGSEHLLLALSTAPTGDPARDTLAELGLTAETIGSHLDRAGGQHDDAALESLGIDLAEVRRRIEAEFGPGSLDQPEPTPRRRPRRWNFGGGHLRFEDDARTVLELSLREAIRRHDSTIESGHLLLGITRLRTSRASKVIEQSVDPGLLRTMLEQRMRESA